MKESKGVVVEFYGKRKTQTIEGVTNMEWIDGKLYLTRAKTEQDIVAVFKDKDVFAVRDYYE